MTRYVSNEVFLIESGYLWALITSIVIRPPIKPARSAVTGSSSHSCQTRQRIRAVLFKQIPPVIPQPSHQRHPSPNKLEPLSVRRPLIVPINLRRSWIAEKYWHREQKGTTSPAGQWSLSPPRQLYSRLSGLDKETLFPTMDRKLMSPSTVLLQ